MTKDNAAQYLPLVQALAEGKPIQANRKRRDGSDNWVTLDEHVMFTCSPELYRIAPEAA